MDLIYVRKEIEGFGLEFAVCSDKPLPWCPDEPHGHFWKIEKGERSEPLDLNPILSSKFKAIEFLSKWDSMVTGGLPIPEHRMLLFRQLREQILESELPEV